ncbi:MAG: sugar phosphate isomerase/epimerase [Planctomycetota bacterium]|nr:MAG: sugar phosphate isomerase/epimerase [Planctomycetota bacterium]
MSHESSRRSFLSTAALVTGAIGWMPRNTNAADPVPPRTTAAPPFSLGIVTYNIAADWDLTTIIANLSKVGLKHVEFRTTHKHGVEPTLSKDQRAEVRKRCEDAGIVIWGLGSTCEFHSPDPLVVAEQIETCKKFLDLAHDLGAQGVKVRPNGLPKEVAEEKTLEQIGRSLIPCGQTARDLNCEVWVEVHGKDTAKPSRMRTIMEHCGHAQVGVCWNSNGDDVVEGAIKPSFELLAPWIKSCHINALDSGYPYRELFSELRRVNYDRVTLIEIGEKVDPTHGVLLLRYYKRLWQELCTGATS